MKRIARFILGTLLLAAFASASAYPTCTGSTPTSGCGNLTTQSSCVAGYIASSPTPCGSCSTTSSTGCATPGNVTQCTKPGVQCTWNGSSCLDGGGSCTK